MQYMYHEAVGMCGIESSPHTSKWQSECSSTAEAQLLLVAVERWHTNARRMFDGVLNCSKWHAEQVYILLQLMPTPDWLKSGHG